MQKVNHKRPKVVIIGDVFLDKYIYGNVRRISPEAPVPVLLKQGAYHVGGGAANVAANVHALGGQACLFGIIGPDRGGEELKALLKGTYHLDIDGLIVQSDFSTISKTRIMSNEQQIVRVDEEHPRAACEDVDRKLLKSLADSVVDADMIVVSDYAKGTITASIYHALVEIARQYGVRIIVDPKGKDFSFYKGATLLTPNLYELKCAHPSVAGGGFDLLKSAKNAVREAECDILVTRSEEGMTLYSHADEVIHEPARRVEVFDVSGAGDTVIATLAVCLGDGRDIGESMHLAAISASIAVQRSGTAIVSYGDLGAALRDDPLHAAPLMDRDVGRECVQSWHRRGEKVVFTNGCFDLIHPGHIQLLREAARLGDKLIVALNSDASIRRLKGPQRPVQNQQDRVAIMSALRGVDMVVIFDEDTPAQLIATLRPDILVKGSDYIAGEVVGHDFMEKTGGEVVLVPILEGRSTTNLIGKNAQKRNK